MSPLRQRQRDVCLLDGTPDAALRPPTLDACVALVNLHLLARGAARARSAEWIHARWKPGVSVTAAFQVEFEDASSHWVCWKRYADDKALHLIQRGLAAENARPSGFFLARWAAITEQSTVLWTPPFDRELPGLECVLDLSRTRRFFAERDVFPGRGLRTQSSIAHWVRYKPERRAVVALELRLRPVGGGEKTQENVFARIHPPEVASSIAAVRASLSSVAPAGLMPRWLAFEERRGISYEESLPVRACEPDQFDHAREAGHMLGVLHGLTAPAAPLVAPFSLASLKPMFAHDARLLAALGELPAVEPDAAHCLVHGDFHPDQVARNEAQGTWHLLDWDSSGVGDPLRDCATWIADHLAEVEHARFGMATEPLLEGYREAGGGALDLARLRTMVAQQLAHLAGATLRRLEQGAHDRALLLLERGRALCEKMVPRA